MQRLLAQVMLWPFARSGNMGVVIEHGPQLIATTYRGFPYYPPLYYPPGSPP